MDRNQVFEAKNVEQVFANVSAYLGHAPTAEDLRAWVNTVLGPWHISSEILAQCAK